MDNIVVITIIAVFWLSGLLMTNSGDASPPVSPS